MIKNKKIFITGGAGFIGSHLCQALLAENEITIYDSYRRNALKFLNLENHTNIRLINNDILNYDSLRSAIKSHDIVIHLAAIAGVSSYYESPLRTMEVNLLGTYYTLKASLENHIELFLNCSTSEVYGPFIFDADENGLTQQGPATVPRWSYSVSKLAAEHFSFAFNKESGIPIVSVRPFNIYGPGQIGEGAIQLFCRNVIKNEDLTVLWDGTQIRSWCFISDFVDAMLCCLSNEKALGQIFNIGNPAATVSILDLAKKIKEISHSDSEIKFKENKFTDVRLRIPSIEKAKKILGFKPCVDLEHGLKKTFDWYKEVQL